MKIVQANSLFPLQKTGADKVKPTTADDKKLRESAKQLEGLFIGFILKAMEKTIPRDDKQNANNMVGMMFSSVMGKELAEQGGFGLSDYLYRAMSQRGEIPVLPNLKDTFTDDIRLNINISENENE